MRISQFKKSAAQISEIIDQQPLHVFSSKDLGKILLLHQEEWALPEEFSTSKFIKQLTKNLPMKSVKIKCGKKDSIRFIWKDVSKYDIFLSLAKKTYFTHQTALFLHKLIDEEKSTIYLNFEQTDKSFLKKNQLSQEGIDSAFQRPQRMTNNIAHLDDDTIYILNGQNTNRCGVTKITTPYGDLDVTGIERTLIDIVVRPEYSGGVQEVLKAYQRAKDLITANNIAEMLKKIGFVYPYHQAIGFLLQKAGYSDGAQLDTLKSFRMPFNFYLARQMSNPAYSEEWKLFYPRDL